MKTIASRANPFFKELRQHARAGHRPDGAVWLEGVHLCEEYLARIGAPVTAVFDASRLAASGEIAALAARLPEAACVALAAGLLAAVSDVAGAQGVGFLVLPPRPALPARIEDDCVVLDGVQDPGNVGSILRTCAAAGVRRVVMLPGTAGAWSPKVLRAGQGAQFSLTMHEGVPTAELLARLAVPLVATTLTASTSLYEAELPRPAAWVFGHEGQGVSAALAARARARIFIPQVDAVESLNVAAAAAVCLFEQRRRRLADGV